MTGMNQRNQALYNVQTAAFALYDTALYLDTHPHDTQALAAFDEYKRNCEAATAFYEEHFGSLCFPEAGNGSCWEWYKGPWPLEAED